MLLFLRIPWPCNLLINKVIDRFMLLGLEIANYSVDEKTTSEISYKET